MHTDRAYNVVVAGRTLFFGNNVDNHVYALDTRTAEKRWRFAAGGAVRFAPVVHDGKLVIVRVHKGQSTIQALTAFLMSQQKPFPTIKATGAVAKSTIEVGSKVAKTAVGATIDLAGSAFRQSAVTVIDASTGLSHKVPWKEGLSASGAAEVAAIKKANKAIEIVRDIQRIKADAGTILKPGDVVRIK